MTRLMLHVIPEDGLGGAEIAARQAALAEPDRLAVASLAGVAHGPGSGNTITLGARHPLSPLAAWRAAGLARQYPVAVFSLWKTGLAMLATAVRAPRTRRVLFLHSDRRVHLADRLATALAAYMADEIWADSQGTLDGLGDMVRSRGRVIAFVLRRLEGRRRDHARPRFIYWGRLTPLKRLDRVVELFALVAADCPGARLTLIGPDAGSGPELNDLVAALGLADRVAFTGALPMSDIAALAEQHDIFLQLSDQEGAAMSLIEAMQLGLVPVVTPVGEMGRYVTPGRSGVIYRSRDQAAAEIARLLDGPEEFARLSAGAVDHWADGRLYQEDVVVAAEDLARREV